MGRSALIAAILALCLAGCVDRASPPSASPTHQAFVHPSLAPEPLKAQFSYDRSTPVKVTPVSSQDAGGVRIEEITYDAGVGTPVDAKLVTPLAPPAGKLAGIVLAHAAGLRNAEYLGDAQLLAVKGAAVLLPTVPLPPNLDSPAATPKLFTDAVRAQRRAVDVLLARSDVDPSRLGFGGHSWGATQAAIMSGVEDRLSAVVIDATTDRLSEYLAPTGEKRTEYLEVLTRFDAVRYVAMPGRRTLFFQFGTQDREVTNEQADRLAAAAVAPKERRNYPTGHDVVGFPSAQTDRVAFLGRVLKLS